MTIAQVSSINRPPKGGVPLQLDSATNIPLDEMYRNCRSAMASGFPVLQERGAIRMQPAVLVGDSPDLKRWLPEISRRKQAGAYVLAVKRTHDLLLENGITPDAAIAADAQRECVTTFKTPRLGVTYFMASTCHHDVWDYLRNYSVIIWHPKIDDRQNVFEEWKGIKKVYGGNTTGLRAISLLWILGYRLVTLIGFQSCVSGNGVMRATGGKTFENDEAFPVCYAGRWFLTTANLAQQVQDFMPTLQLCPGIKIDALGDGALPHVLKTGKAAGWPV